MDSQDWTPVVVKKRASKAPVTSSNPMSQHLRKLENDDIHVKPKMFSHESKQVIIAYRITHGLSQSQLDSMCSFPKNTIQQLEASRKAPSIKELNTLNRLMKNVLTLSN
jgi:hypothetical protein